MKLIDRRDIVPAEVITKSRDLLVNGNWCKTGMDGSGASFEINKSLSQKHSMAPGGGGGVISNPVIETEGAISWPTNILNIQTTLDSWTPPYPNGEVDCNVGLKVSGSALGMPGVLRRVPDGTEVLEAKATLTSGAVTRTYSYSLGGIVDCPTGDWSREPISIFSTTVESLTCQLVGLLPDGGYTAIAEVSGGTPNTLSAIDCGDAISALFATRGGVYIGYALIFIPLGEGGSLADLLPDMPTPETVTYCPSGDPMTGFLEQETTTIEWGTLGFLDVFIKLQYPNGELSELWVPRWPPLGDVPE